MSISKIKSTAAASIEIITIDISSNSDIYVSQELGAGFYKVNAPSSAQYFLIGSSGIASQVTGSGSTVLSSTGSIQIKPITGAPFSAYIEKYEQFTEDSLTSVTVDTITTTSTYTQTGTGTVFVVGGGQAGFTSPGGAGGNGGKGGKMFFSGTSLPGSVPVIIGSGGAAPGGAGGDTSFGSISSSSGVEGGAGGGAAGPGNPAPLAATGGPAVTAFSSMGLTSTYHPSIPQGVGGNGGNNSAGGAGGGAFLAGGGGGSGRNPVNNGRGGGGGGAGYLGGTGGGAGPTGIGGAGGAGGVVVFRR